MRSTASSTLPLGPTPASSGEPNLAPVVATIPRKNGPAMLAPSIGSPARPTKERRSPVPCYGGLAVLHLLHDLALRHAEVVARELQQVAHDVLGLGALVRGGVLEGLEDRLLLRLRDRSVRDELVEDVLHAVARAFLVRLRRRGVPRDDARCRALVGSLEGSQRGSAGDGQAEDSGDRTRCE